MSDPDLSQGEVADGTAGPRPDPPDLDTSGLPPLEYPSTPQSEVIEKARERRRSRVRLEIGGGVILVLGGLGAAATTHSTTVLAIGIGAAAALVAYELLVSSLE
ncbi:MAG: hypothetical protein ACYDGR_08965 [Candidatus Dormibacteria bacterium]